MKAYRITQNQIDILAAIYARLEDYTLTDRRARILAANAIYDILEDIHKDTLAEVHEQHEKPKPTEKPVDLGKTINPPPFSEGKPAA